MKRKISFLTIILIAFMILPYLQTSDMITSAEVVDDPIIPSNRILASPVVIMSDAELIAAGFPGTGTSSDPYRIEDLEIITAADNGIWITGLSGSDSYFIIRNCTIDANSNGINIDTVIAQRATVWNNTIYNTDIGIQITDSDNSLVKNNTVYSCSTAGIRVADSDSVSVYNNTVYNNYRGIYLTGSYHSFVYYNYVHTTQEEGILAENSDEIVIQYNTCDNNFQGIQVYSCFDPFVGNNWCSDNEGFGIYIRYSNYARVGGNNFHACGLGVYDNNEQDLLSLQVTSNYIDGLLIYYGENVTDENIWARYSQFILVNCSNVQISSQDELKSSLARTISVLFCDKIDIRFCYINNGGYGIAMQYCEDIRIYNNTLHHNEMGIMAYEVDGGFIRENEFLNGTIGIYFLFAGNSFSIYQNNFQTYSAYGIVLEDSNYNEVYHNNLVSCGSSHYGYDSGSDNYWYNTTLLSGNYWDNWVSGDYLIEGPEGTYDLYPLSSPWTPPIVSEYIYLSWFVVAFLALVPGLVVYIKKRN